MKTKQLYTLGIILAILILGIVLQKNHKRPELVTEEYEPLNLSFDISAVDKVLIQKGKSGAPVEFAKSGNSWVVTSFFSARGDQKKIEYFLAEIQKASGELRGNGKEVLGDFGITDEKGIHISLLGQNKEILGLVVGTAAAESSGALFVRKKDSTNVYLTPANLIPGGKEPESQSWVARNLMDYDAAKVNRIEIQNYQNGNPTQTTALREEAGVWKFDVKDLPFEPSAEKIKQYVESAKNYPITKVLDPKSQDFGFAKPNLKLKLSLAGEKEIVLTAGKEDAGSNGYFIEVSNEPVVFVFSKYYLENLAPDYPWFFPANPLGIDPDKIEHLTLHADKTEMKFDPVKKKTPALTSYFDNLKNFQVNQILSTKPKFGKYWMTIQKQGGASIALDFADISSKDQKQYAFQKRGNPYVFSLSESLFKQYFGNPAALADSKQ